MSGNVRLNEVVIRNFKRIQDVEISLAPITILVGPNGSGKSAVLQALHMGACLIRQASIINRYCTISLHDADYIPTEYLKEVGYLDRRLGNRTSSPCVEIIFRIEHDFFTKYRNVQSTNAKDDIKVEIRVARNYGISTKICLNRKNDAQGILYHTDFRNPIWSKPFRKYFTAYVPGLSGVRISETICGRRAILRSCSFGDANAYLRNVLFILKEDFASEEGIKFVADCVRSVFLLEQFEIHVKFEEFYDFIIDCFFQIDDCKKPLELLGTGFLQVMQIFSYIALFRPRLLLLDEPDIHLHPAVQERLLKILRDIAEQMQMRVLVATHSPFLVRGAPPDSMIYWLDEGRIKRKKRREVELTLGWGIAGRKILLFTEDRRVDFVKRILSQWPDLEPFVAVHPGSGYKRLPSPEEARDLYETLGRHFKILIHRDRDAMTEEEVTKLRDRYERKNAGGVYLWVTDGPDIEWYFCEPRIMVKILKYLTNEENISEKEIAHYVIGEMKKNISTLRKNYRNARKVVIQEIWADGGGPKSEVLIKSEVDVWANGKWGWARGKDIIKLIDKRYTKSNLYDQIANISLPEIDVIAESLQIKIKTLLNS